MVAKPAPIVNSLREQNSGNVRQSQSIDFAAIKARAEPLIVEILEVLAPDGEMRGSEYLMYNPHRDDGELGSFAYNVDKHVYADFADDEVKGNDIISLTAFLLDIKPLAAAQKVQEIIEKLESDDHTSTEPSAEKVTVRPKRKRKPSKPPSTAIVPIPAEAPAPPPEHPMLGRPSACYQYNDALGRTVCLIYRFNPPGQGKTIRPLTYRKTADGNAGWEWLGLDDARPLYNLYELMQRPEAPVLVVEGEKAADAARRLFPDRVVVTTAGGSGSAEKSDLSPLKRRSILIWPDHDEAGQKYLNALVALLQTQDGKANISVLKIPDMSPETIEGKATLKPGFVAPGGWDAADAVIEGWTAEHVALLLQSSLYTLLPPSVNSKELSIESGAEMAFVMPSEVVDFLGKHYGEYLVYTNQTFFGYLGGFWRALEDLADIKHLIAKYYGDEATPKKVESLFTLLQMFRAISVTSFTPDQQMICMENGTLNTATYHLIDHSPNHGLVNKLNIEWDLEATCPRWMQFLQEIFISDSDKDQKIQFLQQWIGYCLTPDMDQHKFVWMVGTGGNGKSVVLSVLEALVGRKNVGHAQMERFESGAVRAELEGKLVNVSSEMSATATVSDGYLKQIVGGDAIEAERKFKKPHTFKPTVKLIAATNQLPRLLDMSEGFARRAIILTFNRKFSETEMDPKLVEKLLAELPGILVWAVEGLKTLRQRGKFQVPDSSRAELATYRHESDPVAVFIAECLTTSTTNCETPRRIYESYQIWCRSGGFSPLHKINFGKRLANHGFEKSRRGGSEFWMVDIDVPTAFVDPSATMATDDIRENRPRKNDYQL